MIGDILQPTHLLFILVIALVVLGPKRLPEVGRSLGRGIRDFRAAVSGDDDGPVEMVPARTTAETPVPAPAAAETPVPAPAAPETSVPARGVAETSAPAPGAAETSAPAPGAPETSAAAQGTPAAPGSADRSG